MNVEEIDFMLDLLENSAAQHGKERVLLP